MPGSSRGILLLAAAVIVGLFLLSKTENPSPVIVTTQPSKTTTTVPRSTSTTAPAATTTTAVRHDPSQLKVLVLNGVDKKKAIAGPGAKALVNAGFTQATGKDAASTVTKSVVYVVPGFEGDGTVVASLLGISSATVTALPTPLPPEVGNPGDAQIIVVLGPDAPVSTG